MTSRRARNSILTVRLVIPVLVVSSLLDATLAGHVFRTVGIYLGGNNLIRITGVIFNFRRAHGTCFSQVVTWLIPIPSHVHMYLSIYLPIYLRIYLDT